MQPDRYGQPLSTGSAAARDAYVTGVDHILAATYGACEAFAAAIEADAGFALAHAGLARARMYAGDMAGAKAAIADAEGLCAGASARERAHVAIFSALLSGTPPPQVRKLVFSHVEDHPRDVMVAQLCTNIFGLIGLSGEAGRESTQLAFTTSLLKDLGEDWWILSVHGQALCEVGRLEDAMDVMERSLALNNANANASHFKAHTLYEQGASAEGRAYLAGWIAGYDPRALLYGHLAWHRALWAIEQGDEAELWAIYDTAIRPEASQSLPVNILTDAAALLYRAQLAGLSVDQDAWRRISDYAAQYFPEAGMSFADMHSALAHAMAGDGDRLARLAETERGSAADLVRPVAQAWHCIARGAHADALRLLVPVMADTARLGGSRAQRDLLELTYFNLLLKTGQSAEAHRTLSMRRPVFRAHPPVATLH